jgi:hypothetical protein
MEIGKNNNSSSQSASSSSIASTHLRLRPSISEPSAILMNHSPSLHVPEAITPHPYPHRPTIEQNMAFAALQQSQQESNMNNLTIGPTTTTNLNGSIK